VIHRPVDSNQCRDWAPDGRGSFICSSLFIEIIERANTNLHVTWHLPRPRRIHDKQLIELIQVTILEHKVGWKVTGHVSGNSIRCNSIRGTSIRVALEANKSPLLAAIICHILADRELKNRIE
jgi:hypothetical protein